MKVGIAGFAGSGKSTIFQWLTGVRPDPGKAQHGQHGIARIPDERLDWLSAHFRPKKTTYATLEFLDTPGLLLTERRDNPRRLAILRDTGGLLVVLTGFAGGDLAEELKRFREELVFADLEIVTNRMERLGSQLKKPRSAKQKEQDQAELELLRRLSTTLETGKAATTVGLAPDEEKTLRSFQLLTLKPQLTIVNLKEDQLGQPLPPALLQLDPAPLQVAARFELELDELPVDERVAFLKDFLGGRELPANARNSALRSIFTAMGQQVFFTVGEDECRAWSIPKGAQALDGAGEIHTDLARGFVKAEVVSYADFQRCGSIKEAKHHGVYRLESKTYVVQDGDIMHILASS